MFDLLKHANKIGIGVICLSAGILIGAERKFSISITPDVKYTDLIAVILTALGAILAALAIFIAILTIFGWRTFEQRLKDHSVNYFKDELGRDGHLRSEIEELIVDIAHNGIENFKKKEGIPLDRGETNGEEQYDD